MLFDSSVLDRVKNRLNGGNAIEHQASDTQVIPDFGSSILFGNAVTQEIPKASHKEISSKPDDEPRPIRLPQLSLDESDFQASTQIAQPTRPATEFSLGSTQVIPGYTQPDSLEVISIPPQPTLAKEDQSAVLAAELTHVSLTDEENDLNEDADTTRDSSVQKTVTTKAKLQQIEHDLSERKRRKNIQPHFKEQAIDPTKQLLDAFDSDSDLEGNANSERGAHLSPVTSPMKTKDWNPANENEPASDSDFEIDVLDLVTNGNKKPPQKKKLSPIEEYAEKLKNQLNSSPTSTHGELIALDDSDSEKDFNEASSIPKLSKEQAFLIRQKFSRQNLKSSANSLKFHQHPSNKHANTLFNELRRANSKQILDIKKSNPDSELAEEIEKEEEEMGNLLEREMERVRRIRKKEKLLEKAQKALLEDASDKDYDDKRQDSEIDHDSEVPDSEIESEVDESDDEGVAGDSEEEVQVCHDKRTNRSRRVVLSDDDEEVVEVPGKISTQGPGTYGSLASLPDERTDDSYMFGGQTKTSRKNESDDDPIMQIHSDMARPDSPCSSTIGRDTEILRSQLSRLFSNLPPPTAKQDSSMIDSVEVVQQDSIPFQEDASTQKTITNNSFIATQIDGAYTDMTSTQDDNILPTQEDSLSGDEHDINFALENGRKRIREIAQQAAPQENFASDHNDYEDAEANSQNELQERLAMYEAKIRRKELKARKLRKEMERKGIKGIVEGEAEESDDEWKGIGGNDKEDSDQADSEDERMIDNTLNIDLNDEEVRRKFMEQYQIKDRQDLEKLMDDIKNHRLAKRSRSNRFDIELSDEEDEILMAYRRQKLEEQKQRLLENQMVMQGSKSDKTKAFFDSIQEEPNFGILLESELSEEEPNMSDQDAVAEDSAPHTQTDSIDRPKKSVVLEESFVQRQLSFLSKTDEDDYAAIQRISAFQHGSEYDGEDVHALKKRCLSSLYSKPGSSENLVEPQKRSLEEVPTDDDEDDLSRVFKKPSMVSSFRAFRDKHAAQVSTTSFSGVTVNKYYKAASASKASITYMSRQNKSKQAATLCMKSSKTKEIEERVDKAKLESGLSTSKDNFA